MTKSKGKILVVEDDESIRTLMVELLQEEGFKADQAENGKKALEYLRTTRVDPCLVITDLFMPEMDGNTLIQCMRETDTFVTIPVVVVSAAIERHPPKGVAFIKKPLDLDLLIQYVKEWCEEST